MRAVAPSAEALLCAAGADAAAVGCEAGQIVSLLGWISKAAQSLHHGPLRTFRGSEDAVEHLAVCSWVNLPRQPGLHMWTAVLMDYSS